jgi:hypothetical protein
MSSVGTRGGLAARGDGAWATGAGAGAAYVERNEDVVVVYGCKIGVFAWEERADELRTRLALKNEKKAVRHHMLAGCCVECIEMDDGRRR